MPYHIIGADGLAAFANKDWIHLICLTLTCHAMFAEKKTGYRGGWARCSHKKGLDSPLKHLKLSHYVIFAKKTGGGLDVLAKNIQKKVIG